MSRGRTLAALLLAAGTCLPAGAQGLFELGSQGCSMAHCDVRMSGFANLPAPGGNVGVVWRRDRTKRAMSGIGCAANGSVVACTFGDPSGDNLIAYDYDGNRLWSSGALLDDTAWTSAPVVGADGSVLAADDQRIARFDPAGALVWDTPPPGGQPTSPVLTDNGLVVVATFEGPVSAYDLATGAKAGELTIHGNGLLGPAFSTTNTPCVRGHRIYVVAEKVGTNSAREGRLVAIDADASGLREAWHVPFGAPSGTSPLAVGDTIYFAGDRPAPGFAVRRKPTIFAVRDQGDHGELVWTHPVEPALPVLAALTQDPRGGVWFFGVGDENVIRLDAGTGDEIERISLDALVGPPSRHAPGSVMTIAGTAADPVMLVSAKTYLGSSFLVAIDLGTRSLRWKALLSSTSSVNRGSTSGQFPIVMRNGDPRVVFSTWDLGVFAVGAIP